VLEGFDFAGWARLAREDPQAFERERARLIGQLIEAAPAEQRPRLEALQWRVEQVRRLSRTPLAACLKLSSMMWERVTGEHGLLAHLQRLDGPAGAAPHRAPARGTVIPFRPVPDRPPGEESGPPS
jgi:hypothetical protein